MPKKTKIKATLLFSEASQVDLCKCPSPRLQLCATMGLATTATRRRRRKRARSGGRWSIEGLTARCSGLLYSAAVARRRRAPGWRVPLLLLLLAAAAQSGRAWRAGGRAGTGLTTLAAAAAAAPVTKMLHVSFLSMAFLTVRHWGVVSYGYMVLGHM